MPFDWAPEALLAILQNFGTFLHALPPAHTISPAASLKLRTIAFELYSQFILLMNLNGIDYHNHQIAITAQYEHVITFIHRLYNTRQIGSVYDLPQ